MTDEKNPASIEELLDAIDKFNEGDENAFEGMTVVLDGEISEKTANQVN
jgi:hypothetical protein